MMIESFRLHDLSTGARGTMVYMLMGRVVRIVPDASGYNVQPASGYDRRAAGIVADWNAVLSWL